MDWKIDLIGDGLDVTALARVAPAAECTVEVGEDRTARLSGRRFNDLKTAREVKAEAERLMKIFNGILRMNHQHHRVVGVGGGLSRANDSGGRDIVMLAEAAQVVVRGGDVKGIVSGPDGVRKVVSTSSDVDERAKKVFANPDLQEIAAAISESISWQRLRVAYEKLNALLGKGDNAFVSHKYATQDELDRFKANIEDPRHSGLEAVHGVPRGRLKGTKMSIDEGRAFFTRLINRYIDSV